MHLRCFVASTLNVEMGNHWTIDKIQTFGDFYVWGVLLPAPRGEHILEKRIRNEEVPKWLWKQTAQKLASFENNQITRRYVHKYAHVLRSPSEPRDWYPTWLSSCSDLLHNKNIIPAIARASFQTFMFTGFQNMDSGTKLIAKDTGRRNPN